MTFKVHEAKTHLSKLLDRVAAGEEVVIARYGKPVARMLPVVAERGPRMLGAMKGKIWVSEDFDAPLPGKLVKRFYGGR